MTNPAVQVRLLGPLTVLRDGAELPLPASRKARALLAFLATAPAPITRSRACELLFDSGSDPRGELRWCLSRLRGVVDDDHKRRLEAQGDAIALDLSDCLVDTAEIAASMQQGIDQLDLPALRRLRQLFTGDFAEGLELDRNPELASWLSGQRRRFRAEQVAVLERLVARLGEQADSEALVYLEQWLQLAPFARRAHEIMLDTLMKLGRVQEGEAHLAQTIRLFETEGLEWLSIREHWKMLRSRDASTVQASQAARPTVQLDDVARASRRASICVMPFSDRTTGSSLPGGLADGLTEDIITRLAKLRVLFVIARGSVFTLCERDIPPHEAARLLNVDYVASGSVRLQGERILITAELAEAGSGRIVWVDDFTCGMDDAFSVPDEIGNRIVASIAGQIESAEKKRAILKPPNSLDAWEAYHRGLWHMYRFNADDNQRAAHYFHMAVRQDPTFARAHAGLSFTHFQNVFLQWSSARDEEIGRAYATAADSMNADDLDPAAHWAMGRALWLRGRQDDSVQALQQSVALSPNFALGHYALGFVQGQSGDADAAVAATDFARQLSPFDPLLFAMLATRAIALFRMKRYEEAAEWASRAASRPNAHVNVIAVAANCLAAVDRLDEARAFVQAIRRTAPGYNADDYLRAFRFSPDANEQFKRCAARIGLA